MIVIRAGNPSEWTGPTGNNTYLFTGAIPALIDAGVGHAAHLSAVEEGLAGRPLQAVLLTHSHSDHISGVPALLRRWPRLLVRPSAKPFLDGESIAAGDGALSALHTPGHSPDHFCFVDDEQREVYCGDLVRAGGTVVIPASRGGDLRAYLASLRRIRDLRPRRLWPAHGPPIEEPDKLIAEYLAHRDMREQQIVEALHRNRAWPAEIASDVYGDLVPALAPAAADSVLAHLRKLAEEGRAELTERGWRLV